MKETNCSLETSCNNTGTDGGTTSLLSQNDTCTTTTTDDDNNYWIPTLNLVLVIGYV